VLRLQPRDPLPAFRPWQHIPERSIPTLYHARNRSGQVSPDPRMMMATGAVEKPELTAAKPHTLPVCACSGCIEILWTRVEQLHLRPSQLMERRSLAGDPRSARVLARMHSCSEHVRSAFSPDN